MSTGATAKESQAKKGRISSVEAIAGHAREVEKLAVEAVEEQKREIAKAIEASNLGAVQSLPEFLAIAGQLTKAEQIRIVEQAQILIDDFYVHLPLKKSMYAIDPMQRLKLLKTELRGQSDIGDRWFHSEMIDIFVNLRDLHTNYLLPAPYNKHTAFLPFLLEEYYDDTEVRHYTITRMIAGFSHPTFRPGVELTTWNGMPIERAVEINADREAGGNSAARHVRGLDRMTVRPMIMSLPPDAHWVTIGYTDTSGDHEIRLDWNVFSPGAPADGVAMDDGKDTVSMAIGLDLLTEATNRARKILFAPKAMDIERRVSEAATVEAAADILGEGAEHESLLPNILSFKAVPTIHGKFGYVRIRSFSVNPVIFLTEFIRILGLLPQDGLIIDVRNNGGGVIMSGERLLQLLTPRKIEAERLHFINTDLTEKLSDRVQWLERWRPSMRAAVRTGAVYSQGFTIEPRENSNRLGQQYRGPVVLITDARCYSTTDIFAAGFQDHEIGEILGVDNNTGAGGANVWTHGLLRQLLAGPDSSLESLPNGANMRVAIRRTTRVGERSGQPVEDLGVVPDIVHRITKNDLLNDNADLIEMAAKRLAQKTVRRLDGTAKRTSATKIKVGIKSRNIDYVNIYADDRPMLSADVTNGTNNFVATAPTARTAGINIHGFDQGELVAFRHLTLTD